MPINRSLYPDNWEAIAHSIKTAANWTCQECGKPCRPPGVSQVDTERWLTEHYPEWLSELYQEVYDPELGIIDIPKPQRFTLTTAHLDHNPANCATENLKALCAPCHLILDGSDWNRTRKARELTERERHGQLTLQLTSRSANDLELEGD